MDDRLRKSVSHREYLQQLWSENLNVPRVGLNDDFFEAGGSSMQVIEMLTTVTNKFGCEINYEAFFKAPCIETLDALIRT